MELSATPTTPRYDSTLRSIRCTVNDGRQPATSNDCQCEHLRKTTAGLRLDARQRSVIPRQRSSHVAGCAAGEEAERLEVVPEPPDGKKGGGGAVEDVETAVMNGEGTREGLVDGIGFDVVAE